MNEMAAMMDEQEDWTALSFAHGGPVSRDTQKRISATGSYMNAMLMSVQERRAQDIR